MSEESGGRPSAPGEPRVVMITGASAGVGRAAARAFAERGARVGLFARGRERLEHARAEVEERGGEGVVLPGDVSDPDDVEEAASELEDRFGRVDVWVNNAMVTVFSRAADMSPEEYRRVTGVTYLGTVHGTLAALRRMVPRDRGHVIQVGSALAYRGIPLQSAYCGAKHAIQGFTESVRSELEHDGSDVTLTMLQMPALNTPQFDWVRSRMPRKAQPMPPIFQPEVAADAIVWASEHDRQEMYVGGAAVKTIVGNRIAPRLLDRYLAHTGVDAQLTEEAEDPGRPDNLWEPVSGDPGARGRFDDRAASDSTQLWATKNRGWLAALGGAAVAACGALWLEVSSD